MANDAERFRFNYPGLPPGQFRVLPTNTHQGNRRHTALEIGSYTLEYDDLLAVAPIIGRSGRAIGAMLGTAFDTETATHIAPGLLAQIEDTPNQDMFVEGLYGRLFGRWSMLLEIGGKLRLYLDPAGTQSAVYSRKLQRAGGTATAILSADDYKSLFREHLYRRLGVAKEGWFPSGLTAHEGVSRLLCNHYLDLETWSPVRHWPIAAPSRAEDPAPLLREIAEQTRRNMRIALDHYRCAMAITGGYDTRMLLSLFRPKEGERLRTFIINVGDGPDPYLASKLAAESAVQHHEFRPDASTPAEIEDWHMRVGNAIGGTNATIYTTLRRLAPVDALVEGFGGEVARAFFWRESDNASDSIDGRAICIRFGMPLQPEVVAATTDWLATLPPGDAFYTLDMAYLELRVSAWLYTQSYIDPPLRHLSPMISRRIFDSMFRLPPSIKRGNGMPRAIIAQERPEFMRYGFSRYGDLRDVLFLLKKAAKPHVLAKKVRKLWAK